jgi:2-hydroxychromene-2-carboxylate isomerase
MLVLDVYFDYSCPWSYLAFVRAREAAMRTGAEIRWRPVLADRIFEAVKSRRLENRLAVDPGKAAYQQKDLKDWARFCSISITLPDGWPVDSTHALSGAIVAIEQDLMVPYCNAVFEAYFENAQDISKTTVLAKIAASVGLDPKAFKTKIRESKGFEQVLSNSNELIERGGFGIPTMFVGDDMYFGNHSMPLVELALGQASDSTFIMPGEHSSLG